MNVQITHKNIFIDDILNELNEEEISNIIIADLIAYHFITDPNAPSPSPPSQAISQPCLISNIAKPPPIQLPPISPRQTHKNRTISTNSSCEPIINKPPISKPIPLTAINLMNKNKNNNSTKCILQRLNGHQQSTQKRTQSTINPSHQIQQLQQNRASINIIKANITNMSKNKNININKNNNKINNGYNPLMLPTLQTTPKSITKQKTKPICSPSNKTTINLIDPPLNGIKHKNNGININAPNSRHNPINLTTNQICPPSPRRSSNNRLNYKNNININKNINLENAQRILQKVLESNCNLNLNKNNNSNKNLLSLLNKNLNLNQNKNINCSRMQMNNVQRIINSNRNNANSQQQNGLNKLNQLIEQNKQNQQRKQVQRQLEIFQRQQRENRRKNLVQSLNLSPRRGIINNNNNRNNNRINIGEIPKLVSQPHPNASPTTSNTTSNSTNSIQSITIISDTDDNTPTITSNNNNNNNNNNPNIALLRMLNKQCQQQNNHRFNVRRNGNYSLDLYQNETRKGPQDSIVPQQHNTKQLNDTLRQLINNMNKVNNNNNNNIQRK